jgi:ATP-dependent helicase YprA (DUF1998 family)
VVDHLSCLAAEMGPLTFAKTEKLLNQFSISVDRLQPILDEHFKYSPLVEAYHYKGGDCVPSRRFQIRNISNGNFQVIDSGTNSVIEVIEEDRVSYTLYDGKSFR